MILYSAFQPQTMREMAKDKKRSNVLRVLSGGQRKIMRADASVIILVTTLAIVLDLATAVIAGVVLSALCFAWNQSSIGSSSVLVKRSVSEMKARLNNCRRLSCDDDTNDEKEKILL